MSGRGGQAEDDRHLKSCSFQGEKNLVIIWIIPELVTGNQLNMYGL
jgi:hypothetical protein